jgi:tetratricopeptide (TPR) repeat protein
MDASQTRRLNLPLALAAAGATCAFLAAADKVFGLVQHPLYLATLAYVFLFVLVAWGFIRGIRVRPTRRVRFSVYASVLLLTILTAAYVFAWRVSADPTPVVLQAELARGDALLEAGKKDEAHLAYLEAYKRYPNSFPVLMRMGAVSYRLTDYERARRFFTRAAEAAPSSSVWKAHNDLGQAYWMLKQPQKAIELYRQAREEGLPDSEQVEWHYRMAWAYFDANNYDAAIEQYRAVAQAGQKYSAASFYNMACAQAQKYAVTKDPAVRRALAQDAAANIRSAWVATTRPQDRRSLEESLMGSPERQDPDLAPLRKSPQLQALLRELRAD